MADATRIAATPEARTNLVFFRMAAPHTIAFGYVRRPDCAGRGDEQTARVADEVRAGCQQRVPNDMATSEYARYPGPVSPFAPRRAYRRPEVRPADQCISRQPLEAVARA